MLFDIFIVDTNLLHPAKKESSGASSLRSAELRVDKPFREQLDSAMIIAR